MLHPKGMWGIFDKEKSNIFSNDFANGKIDTIMGLATLSLRMRKECIKNGGSKPPPYDWTHNVCTNLIDVGTGVLDCPKKRGNTKRKRDQSVGEDIILPHPLYLAILILPNPYQRPFLSRQRNGQKKAHKGERFRSLSPLCIPLSQATFSSFCCVICFSGGRWKRAFCSRYMF